MRALTVFWRTGHGVLGSVDCAYAAGASESSNASTNNFCARKSKRNSTILTPQSISDLGYPSRMKLHRRLVLLLFLLSFSSLPAAAQSWTAKLDKDIRFYQSTELGVVIAGTEKSLYGIDGDSGEILWRRKDASLDETDVAPVPGTDLVLLSFEKGDKARIEAIDVLSGDSIWRSEKIKGAVMQMSVDPTTNLLAVVLVKDAK